MFHILFITLIHFVVLKSQAENLLIEASIMLNDDLLLFDDPSLIFTKDHNEKNHPMLASNINGDTNSTKKRQRKTKPCNQETEGVECNEGTIKKIMHRDIERQRRQEMAGLYASLRSHLPLEYIKGKRSISDHMHGAVNYIKHMENNISQLKTRRDNLKKSSDTTGSGNGSSSAIYMPVTLTVSSCIDATVEILITCGFNEEDVFPLSKVIALLIESGLTVFSCVTTKANERVLHRFQAQGGDLVYIDLPLLQQKLVNMINICTNFWVNDQSM